MTLRLLDVAPRDVAAEALGLVLQAPAPAALAEISLPDGRGGLLTLGVLGASHVVTAAAGAHRLTEQVSCDAIAAGGEELPRRARLDSYELVSATIPTTRADLDRTAARLRARAGRNDSWLCGAFPGTDSAITALVASPLPSGGWTWKTWHLYPHLERNVIVTTKSRWSPP